MTTLQEQARALGDPTRHSIFRYIADSDQPADVTEMTAHFGLNHNAIRQHLAKLVDAGLIVESTAAARGRGRPKLQYTVEPAADGRWGVTSPYERLSVLLTEMIHDGETPVEAGAAPADAIPSKDRPQSRRSWGSRRRWPGRASIPKSGIVAGVRRSCCGTARSSPPPSPIRTRSARCTSAWPVVLPRAPRSRSRI